MHIDQGRRHIMFALPVVALLSACVRPSKALRGGWGQFAADAGRVIDNSAWDAFLARYVRASVDGVNRVAYAEAAAADAQMLRPYLTSLEAVDPATLARDEQMAFWINLYNAATVDLILQQPGVKSIRDLGPLTLGPWDRKIITLAGNRLSLNDVEHGILRPIWRDVRIHYAVNCASIGCPNLAPQAYTAARLEAMLEQAAIDFINHPRGFARVDGKLRASSIFNWYGSDWGSVGDIIAHARRYARGDTSALFADATGIDTYAYDWALNAA
ncbi:MAG: DUF547 domain-containing protein [Sphingopyxis sp.]|nr:DUF547 domain-containing protein [Sphingopyxis sp.]